jgi:hypothetical protein
MSPTHEPGAPCIGVPMFVWPLVAILVLGVLAVALRLADDSETLPVPAADIAAGQLVTAADLVDDRVDGYGLGKVARERSKIEGRVARVALKRGDPVPEGSLTARVPADYSTRLGLRFRAENAATVDVTNGQRVKLLFAPTGAARTPAPAAIDAVLIDAAEDGDATEYFIAIAPGDRDTLLGLVGRARLLVTNGSRLGVSASRARTRRRTPRRRRRTSSTTRRRRSRR